MAIPKQEFPPTLLKIGYGDYKIVPCTKGYAWKKRFRGITHFDREQIMYDQTLTRNEMANVIIHECLHVIIDTMGIKFKTVESEEDAVYKIANGITALLKENPKLIRWLNMILKNAERERVRYAKTKRK